MEGRVHLWSCFDCSGVDGGVAPSCLPDGLVAGLAWAGCIDPEIALAKAAVKEVKDEPVELEGELRVVACAFIAHKGMSAVDLVPAELCADLIEAAEHLHARFGGDVRILAAPHHQELAADVFGAIERIIVHAFAEATFVDVGGVEARGCEDIGVHGGAKGEVASDADADGPSSPVQSGRDLR